MSVLFVGLLFGAMLLFTSGGYLISPWILCLLVGMRGVIAFRGLPVPKINGETNVRAKMPPWAKNSAAGVLIFAVFVCVPMVVFFLYCFSSTGACA
jgi:hypothetical protein